MGPGGQEAAARLKHGHAAEPLDMREQRPGGQEAAARLKPLSVFSVRTQL